MKREGFLLLAWQYYYSVINTKSENERASTISYYLHIITMGLFLACSLRSMGTRFYAKGENQWSSVEVQTIRIVSYMRVRSKGLSLRPSSFCWIRSASMMSSSIKKKREGRRTQQTAEPSQIYNIQ